MSALESAPASPVGATAPPRGAGPAGPSALLVAVLVLLSFVEPLGTDVYLPAFPGMVDELATTPTVVQLTLTTFMIGLAVGHLVFGPLSDRVGRRGPLLVGTAVAALAGAACALAPSVTWLAALRLLQGAAAASGMVIARSIISDTASGARAARLFGVVMALLGVAPILAPLLGGLLLGVGSWRTVFWALAAATAALAVAVALVVPETLPDHGGSGTLRSSWRTVLTNRTFLAQSVAFACAFGALFCYVSGSSFLYQEVFGLGVGGNAWAVAGTVLVHSATALTGARLARRIPSTRLVWIGLTAMVAAGCGLGAAALAGVLGLVATLALTAVFFVGTGLVMPNATAVAFDALPHSAGTGSAALGFLQNAAAALAAPVVGLAGGLGVAVALAGGMTAASALGVLALAVLDRRTGRDRTPTPAGPEPDPGIAVVRGVVRTVAGRPLPGATVTLMHLDGRQAGVSRADDAGRFECTTPAGGSFVVLGTSSEHPPVAERLHLAGGGTHEHDLVAPSRPPVTPVIPVTPATPVTESPRGGTMTTASPAAVLARFHEAEGRFFASEGAEMPSFDGILHPDFALIEPADGPYGGSWPGHDGLERFLRAMVADWAEQGPQSPPVVLENDDTAVALATVAATCRGTGRSVLFPMVQVARIRDGLLVEARVYYEDTREMNEALAEARS